jgi:hypothetical protein
MGVPASTGNIADGVGPGEALRYVEQVGVDPIAVYERTLLACATLGPKLPVPRRAAISQHRPDLRDRATQATREDTRAGDRA